MSRPSSATTSMRFVLGLFIALASSARAGNDDSMLMGNDAVISGGAVAATTTEAMALWYNPAGLAGADRCSTRIAPELGTEPSPAGS